MSTDRKAALILLTFCGFFTAATFRISNQTLPGSPSPRVFPLIMDLLLAILSVVIFIRGGKKDDADVKRQPLLKAGAIYLTIVFYLLLVYLIGFLPGTIIGLFVFMQWTVKSKIKAVTVSAAAAVILFVLFQVIFRIHLPKGILFS